MEREFLVDIRNGIMEIKLESNPLKRICSFLGTRCDIKIKTPMGTVKIPIRFSNGSLVLDFSAINSTISKENKQLVFEGMLQKMGNYAVDEVVQEQVVRNLEAELSVLKEKVNQRRELKVIN